jgi:hypothetical protein
MVSTARTVAADVDELPLPQPARARAAPAINGAKQIARQLRFQKLSICHPFEIAR